MAGFSNAVSFRTFLEMSSPLFYRTRKLLSGSCLIGWGGGGAITEKRGLTVRSNRICCAYLPFRKYSLSHL